jgi:ADP-ribose pyrophosphatase YjhB (NUDIX family)
MKEKRFCDLCGNRLDKALTEGRERLVCRACGRVCYENPLPVVSVILSNRRGELLLVRRAQEPAKGMWCFPIGFAECGETIEEAALRELKEEAGVEGKIVELIDVCSDRTSTYGEVVVVTFRAEKVGGREAAGDDACDVGYFPPTDLPRLAFSSQERAWKKLEALPEGRRGACGTE